MKLNRQQIRKIILEEIKLTESSYAGMLAGLEIFRDSMWGNPDNWRYVADSSIAQVIQPILQRGKDPNKILAAVLPFQREQVSNVIQKLTGRVAQPETHSDSPKPQYVGSSEDAGMMLTTPELFKLFNAGFSANDLRGINRSNLSSEMAYVLRS